ncbi:MULTISPECIES: DUF389 domain-containing protein [Leptolyngbya]|uniref:TIGR00341 family protein n=2 Tax=Leptolyngbya boryana TaxID=1184 RepID=A0A1Z4JFE1_LEPBY|nr:MULTISPECIES: DUF389 domain-containing protein [Leptolyngbya]MBD2368397.1 DUF389 domain-containing protein [Leptolyngbya sp. FACHB-161]MBD2374947.1 DUF389 domain-containing protein [Leptolyngbya sp. FACHB-238]MBD2399367.1 DUF389 domain-containing protein [Leptolyngbya sp. FACHB-239]MBD2405572.1 DUF389 domain-containing protein [Leptolyngbya sp. FACHB-402]BAY55451.1 hypothetical protein NIES2135_22740 [Leptolyngbya boryana NIES-2135]
MIINIRNRFSRFRKKKGHPNRIQQVQTELLDESTLSLHYLILIMGSCAIATFGLLSNSAAVIIGAMIIAPLMLPIRGIAFGALSGDLELFRKGAIAVIVGTLLALLMSLLLGLMVGLPSYGSEVLARSRPTLLDLGVAVVAGAISAYAKAEPRISGTLAGTAIAVALMPPVCTIGLGLAQTNSSLSLGATLLYLTNLLGIALSCALTFLLIGYAPFKRARKALIWMLVLTSVLLLPLGVSFARLVRQAQLEMSLERALLNRTVTFQRMELLNIQTNWLTTPPEVYLSVRSRGEITPNQVQLLEQFIQREMGRQFTLIFSASQIEEVRGQPNPSNSTPQKRR